MSGTKAGAAKAKLKILENNPNHYKQIGSKGGKATRGYQFGHGKLDPVETGRKGGLVRKKKNV